MLHGELLRLLFVLRRRLLSARRLLRWLVLWAKLLRWNLLFRAVLPERVEWSGLLPGRDSVLRNVLLPYRTAMLPRRHRPLLSDRRRLLRRGH